MIDWTKAMHQSFEYYFVDPVSWRDKDPITTVLNCNINRDNDKKTLQTASFAMDGAVGEAYVRAYLVAVQNGERHREPLGTFMIQSPSYEFNGISTSTSYDAYSPLVELKEKLPPLGYSRLKNVTNIMDAAYECAAENMRGPVVKPASNKILHSDFVAENSETWLDFVDALAAEAEYHLDLDEMGRLIFAPNQEFRALGVKWTFDDSNSSILSPAISISRDLYGIPNVVEVIYSDGYNYWTKTVRNEDPSSPVSIQNRGREIHERLTNPSGLNANSQAMVDEFASKYLESVSTVSYSISYSHGYCPVRVGDCIRLNYSKAGLNNVKALITGQSISCNTGCTVAETAVFTQKLWSVK